MCLCICGIMKVNGNVPLVWIFLSFVFLFTLWTCGESVEGFRAGKDVGVDII